MTTQEETDLRKNVSVWLLSCYPQPRPWGADSPRPERFGLMRKTRHERTPNCCSRDRNRMYLRASSPGLVCKQEVRKGQRLQREGLSAFLPFSPRGPQSSTSGALQTFQRVGVILSISCLRGDPGRRFSGYANESRFCQSHSITSEGDFLRHERGLATSLAGHNIDY